MKLFEWSIDQKGYLCEKQTHDSLLSADSAAEKSFFRPSSFSNFSSCSYKMEALPSA